MANLPSQHPHLSLHLTDRSLTPLITSAPRSGSPSRLEALTSLSHAALAAHESASRLGLGAPLRVMVEHADSGPVVLQSFLRADTSPSPTSTTTTTTNDIIHTNTNPPSTSASSSTAADPDPEPTNGTPNNNNSPPTSPLERRLQQLQFPADGAPDHPDPEDANAPPMLISVVVAPTADEARDARRAAARLERVGRAIQAQWADVQVQVAQDGSAGDAGD
ncbi:hypothetical protein F5Y00DRAFT_235981 [Daldinia vernicosa]|uniref:uncharacterized protein n=1 Tax=Daldinia vernicosa TaxID=114800 RepID=UPI0020074DBB|nr:uncharacterized protein F5Y00DRAFT_235981 [Daldinia vernicosa]KAI0849227.1 hypothetical protein F5Y00DRAFT_235981 [Daldinia vernicosa]